MNFLDGALVVGPVVQHNRENSLRRHLGAGDGPNKSLIAQDLSQIEMKYSKANIETIVSTTAAKLIPPLNNEQTAKRFASMVGKTTVRRRSTSHQSGYTKEAVNLSSNVSDSQYSRSCSRSASVAYQVTS